MKAVKLQKKTKLSSPECERNDRPIFFRTRHLDFEPPSSHHKLIFARKSGEASMQCEIIKSNEL
jgi:hypothetical protein